MSRLCAICGKGPVAGRRIKRRGMAKSKGGAGRKITGISKRRFLPNLQKIKTVKEGVSKIIYVCTKCIKAGKVASCRCLNIRRIEKKDNPLEKLPR